MGGRFNARQPLTNASNSALIFVQVLDFAFLYLRNFSFCPIWKYLDDLRPDNIGQGSHAQSEIWKSAKGFELNIQLFPNETRITGPV